MFNPTRKRIALVIATFTVAALSVPLVFDRAYQMQIRHAILEVSFNTQLFSEAFIKNIKQGVPISEALAVDPEQVIYRLSRAADTLIQAHTEHRYHSLMREVNQLETRLKAETLRQTMATEPTVRSWSVMKKKHINYDGFKNDTMDYINAGMGASRQEASIWQAQVDSHAIILLMDYFHDVAEYSYRDLDDDVKSIKAYYPYVSYWLKPYLENPENMLAAFYGNKTVNGPTPRDLMFTRLRSDNVLSNREQQQRRDWGFDLRYARLYHGALGDMFGSIVYHPQHDWRYSKDVTSNLMMKEKVDMPYFHRNESDSLFHTHRVGLTPYWRYWQQ